MRKLFSSLIIIMIVIFACESNKDYLDKKPHSQADEPFYTSEDGAIQGLNAAYDILQLGEQVERVEFTGTVCSGDAMAGGEPGGNDQPPMQHAMKFQILANESYVNQYWAAMYRGIYRCNLLLFYLADPIDGFDNDLRNRIRGEALFLRGLFHFKLQIVYGGFPQLQTTFGGALKGVPYIDHLLAPDEWKPVRPELNYTWQKIEEDFKAAADLLPTKGEYSDVDAGRATQEAANAMLAKTYLYQEKWSDAYNTAKAVIESGVFYLYGDNEHPGPFPITRLFKDGEATVNVPGFKYFFGPEGNNGGESIFEVQHYAEHSTRWPEGMEGNLLPRYYGPRNVIIYQRIRNAQGLTVDSLLPAEYFWGFILPTYYFINTAFKDANGGNPDANNLDPRYKISVVDSNGMFPYYYANAEVRALYPDSVKFNAFFNWPCTGFCTWKYFTDPMYTIVRTTLGDNPQNSRYFRFADLLLMGAEAAVNVGGSATTDALTWINWVRERARNCGTTGYPQDLTTVTLEAIYAERRVELAFEGHQFYDIVRTGRATKVLKEDAMEYPTMENPNTHAIGTQQWGNAFTVGKNEIWPIPETEIDATEGSFSQNPNY